nr:AraC family transcriptional regulator [Fulvivirga lutimaris]
MAAATLRNPLTQDVPNIETLASLASMSTTKFKLLFKQLFGSSPIQYHHKIRMEYAKDELITKRKTPTELSYEFGYSHPSNFTTAFKKYFNELPSNYL